ncbi:efflux RND transporter periplasmic adaptor subunit [Permianibacter sp. IMCC34836]|nr:efflux RND transporter periplasmic adaptor subunit [Permianibacter fluminis]
MTLVAPTSFAAEHDDDHKEGQHEEAAHDEGKALTTAEIKQLGIVTETLRAERLSDEIRAPGEVKSNAYATTLISPRIPALVQKRHAKLGDAVKAGQPLVTLTSIELAEAQGALLVADREWQRVKALGSEAVSGRRYLEAQVARDQALAKGRAFGMHENAIDALLAGKSGHANGELTLLAPHAGRLTSDDFLIGERAEPGRTLFTLVNEAQVWIVAQLPPSSAERIAVGASVRVVAHDKIELLGKVIQLSHRAEEGTRTMPVRIEVRNDKDQLHPGEFAEVWIATQGSSEQLAVPKEALVQLGGQMVLFKANGPGDFDAVPVKTGAGRGDRVILENGVKAGDVVVVKGAYALKARQLKSQMGEGDAD